MEIGEVIEGKYRITDLIGEGGMGAVYLGENIRIQRKVAIKVLHAAYAENADVVARFEREAQAAGRIGNDHIMEVLDLGQLEDGDLFLVMEFLDGEPLSSRLQNRGRFEPQELVELTKQTLEGLHAAHEAGIIHRDLKPDNIFVLKEKAGQKDYVKIIDFGISKFQPMSGDGMKMTKTGAMMGTPYYMSPEQASGSSEADARSDIYAIGVIMYECMTGAVPFDAPSFNQLLFKIALSEPPPLDQVRPDLDPAFCSLISKAMAREPADRFQSCVEFIEAMDEWVKTGRPVTVPPPTSEEALKAKAVGDQIRVSSYPTPGQVLPVSTPGSGVPVSTPGSGIPVSTPGSGVPVSGHAATTGSWATSQVDAPKSSAGLIAVLAVVGVLVLGGGAFAAYSVARGGDAEGATGDEPAAAAAVDPASTGDPAASAKSEPAVTPAAEVDDGKSDEASDEDEDEDAEKAAKADEEDDGEEAAAEPAKPTPAPRPAPKPVAVRPAPAPAPAPAPVAAPRPAPKPAPKPAPPSGGTPDFGY